MNATSGKKIEKVTRQGFRGVPDGLPSSGTSRGIDSSTRRGRRRCSKTCYEKSRKCSVTIIANRKKGGARSWSNPERSRWIPAGQTPEHGTATTGVVYTSRATDYFRCSTLQSLQHRSMVQDFFLRLNMFFTRETVNRRKRRPYSVLSIDCSVRSEYKTRIARLQPKDVEYNPRENPNA